MPVVFNPFTGNLDLIDNTAAAAAAGGDTQVQFNDGGVLGGDSGLVFNKTTNALTGGAFIPNGSTVPANGLYAPAANSVALSTNSSGRIHIGSTGTVNIVGAGTAGTTQAVSFNGSAPVNSVVLDSSGGLLVGTSSSRAVTAGGSDNWSPKLQVTKTGVDAANIAVYSFSTYAIDLGGGLGIGPDIVLARSNSDTEGIQTAIANNMLLGRITFNGSDGTAFRAGAFIAAASDGQTWVSGDYPTRLVFSVTADGASSPTEAMRIKNSRILNFANTPVYADNAAAKTGGLVDGDVYRKSDGTLMIVYT